MSGKKHMPRAKGIFIQQDVLESRAFKELPGEAVKLLLLFYRRRQMEKTGKKGHETWSMTNNGELIFTFNEAVKKFGYTKPRFTRWRNSLIEFGFLDIEHHGSGLRGDCNKYRLGTRWLDYGTKDFIKKSPPKNSRGGFAFAKRKAKTRNEIVTQPSNKNVTCKSLGTGLSGNENVPHSKCI